MIVSGLWAEPMRTEASSHTGDVCWHDGKLLYVSFYPGEKGAPDLVAYDKDLKPVRSFSAKASNGLEFVGMRDGTPRFIKCETVKKDGGISARIVPAELKPCAVAN